jgi:hypothetical protein
MNVPNESGSPITSYVTRCRASQVLSLALTLAALLAPAASRAAEITWFAGNGVWSAPGNWWPNQVPAHGDVAWVKATSGNTLWVFYRSATAPWHHTVHVDSVGNGLGIVVLNRDLLNVGTHNVGLTGQGAMAVENTGTHQVGTLNIGFWGGSAGDYNIDVGGTLTAGQVVVGVGGAGIVRHSGGSGSVSGDLVVGFLRGATGTYELSPGAQLSANRIFVGDGAEDRHHARDRRLGIEETIG